MVLNEEEISEIIKAHELYDGNVRKATKNLDYSGPTISKYWEKNNLQIKHRWEREDGKRSSAIDDESISEIIQAYRLYEGNATIAAKNLCLSHPTVLKYWKKQGFEIRKKFQRKSPLELSISI